MRPGSTVVIIGDLEVARRSCEALRQAGFTLVHILRPTDDEVRAVIDASVAAVAVLVRGDVIALRYALLIEYLRPDVRLVVTLFDRTVSEQLVNAVPNCVVTSPAEVAVPTIIEACLGQSLVVRRRRIVRCYDVIRTQLRPHDTSSAILMAGLCGLVLTLGLDWLVTTLALHFSPVDSFYAATRVIATVGPGESTGSTPHWYLVFAGLSMLATIGWTALFTAGIVNLLLSSRSVGLVGRRTLPRRDHVIVVGLGQVGLRLCLSLRALGVSVVAIERDPRAANLRLAKQANVPVLIGHAEDRAVLNRLGLARARAVAAMGSDDTDNIEVAIAALAVCPEVRAVIRAGEDEVIAETRSLFHIGQVVDVSDLTAQAITSAIVTDSAAGSKPANGSESPAFIERCGCEVPA